MERINYYAYARQVADGCFDEVKYKEKEKQRYSVLLLIALLCTTFLSNIYLYIFTFLAFILQVVYILIVRETKILNAKAQEAHKLRLYFTLFRNHSILVELSNLHASLKNETIKNVESRKYESYDDTTPHEINRVRKLYWILQENCFYNKTLYKLEGNIRIKRLLLMLLILILVLSFHSYFPTLVSNNNLIISLDIYFLPRFAFIAFSSFKVIELIEEMYDFRNGSNEMERLYEKIEKLSKKPKMDELLTIITIYYSVLRQTPNISNDVYRDNNNKLRKSWEKIYKTAHITKHKAEIVDTLKIISGLLCNTSSWCIIGSTARFLQGEDVKPNDIDILTDEEGIASIIKNCSAFIYEKPVFQHQEDISSIYGLLMINNISIEVMANLKGNINNEWEYFDCTNIITIDIDCISIKLRDIKVEKDIQNRLKNKGKS